MSKKTRKILIWSIVLVLIAGIAIAALELAGQANKSAAKAGLNSADMEMASLESIQKPSAAKIDWKKERELFKKVEAIDGNYRTKLTQAQSEIDSTGKVSDGTKSEGLSLAHDFNMASEEYAKFWDKNNGPTRAGVARKAGQSRLASAEMAFNEIDSDKIAENEKQQKELRTAQQAYFADAKKDMNDADRAKLKSNMMPRMQSMASSVLQLINDLNSLVSKIQSQVSSATSSPLSFATGLVTGQTENPLTLLENVKSLFGMINNLSTNINNMTSDLNSL